MTRNEAIKILPSILHQFFKTKKVDLDACNEILRLTETTAELTEEEQSFRLAAIFGFKYCFMREKHECEMCIYANTEDGCALPSKNMIALLEMLEEKEKMSSK